MNGFGGGYFNLPPVVKNIILINVLMLLVDFAAKSVFGVDLTMVLGLYFPKSEQFMPLQIVTHMFMHGGFWHIFFNMYALYIFGQVLENVWGPKRFFIYYIICGLGAALTHETVIAFQYAHLAQGLDPDSLQTVLNEGTALFRERQLFTDPDMQKLQLTSEYANSRSFRCYIRCIACFRGSFPKHPAYAAFPSYPDQGKILCSDIWRHRALYGCNPARKQYCTCSSSWRNAVRLPSDKVLEKNH